METNDSNSSAVEGIQEEITWFHAWLALDRLITAVRQEVKSSQVYESNKNYNSKNGRITVKIKDYQEISGFTPGVLNRLFGQRNKMTEWRDRVLSMGRITFEENSHGFERRKVEFRTKEEDKSYVPWKLVLKQFMGTGVQQELEEANTETYTSAR
mmetsp:Transcript_7790/g.13183  ORF Transcript_7790/g.13183 Transcript_7790/m.13183 type:complete len:155 (+) Transcript_7790:146-610(+)